MVCTSGFVNDVMFSHNAANRQNHRRRVFCQVGQMAAQGRSLPYPTASFVLSALTFTGMTLLIRITSSLHFRCEIHLKLAAGACIPFTLQ